MASSGFFDKQFAEQIKTENFELNPFERLSLDYLQGRVLDFGCGLGNLSLEAARRGHPVLAIDLQLSGVSDLLDTAGIELLQADLECPQGHDWPLGQQRFAGIIVTNYLYRPNLHKLVDNLAADGVLIYATFALGNEQFGRPRNPDFLLAPGELQKAFGTVLHTLAYEEVTTTAPNRAVRQRICAVGAEHPATAD